MRSRILALLTALVLAAGGTRPVAQETTGAVTGRVTDPQGLAVPGATVTLTGPQGAKTVVTDAEGRFRRPCWCPAPTRSRRAAGLQGRRAEERRRAPRTVHRTADLTMQVGGVAETVEVTASSPIVDTRSTTVGAVLDSDDAREHPGRPALQRCALRRARRHEQRQRGPVEPVDGRRQRPRQPVRRRRREHHQRRLRRARVLLDRVRLARQRHAVRLHAGSAGQDRRLRGRVRPGDRRRRQRRHQERHEPAARAASSATPGRAASRATASSIESENGTVQTTRHRR